MSNPPTPSEIAKRSADVRRGWINDKGVILPVSERPDYSTPSKPTTRRPLTAEIHAMLVIGGRASVTEIARQLCRDERNTRKAIKLKRDVLFRRYTEGSRHFWEAIQ